MSVAQSQSVFRVSPAVWLWLLVGVSLAIRLVDIREVTLWIDEAYSLMEATNHLAPDHLWSYPVTLGAMYQRFLAWQPMSWAQLMDVLKQDVHMPLYYWGLHFWLGWMGNDTFGLRSFSTLFSCLMLLPVYWLGKRISAQRPNLEQDQQEAKGTAYDSAGASVSSAQQATAGWNYPAEAGGLWAAFFCGMAPFQLLYAQDGRMYAMAMFWATLSSLTLWQLVEYLKTRAIQRRDSSGQLHALPHETNMSASRHTIGQILLYVAFYTGSLLGGLFTHYMFLFFLGFHAVYVLLSWYRTPGKGLKGYGVFLAPAALVALGLELWYPMYKIQQSAVEGSFHFAKGYMSPIRYFNKLFLMPMEALAGNNGFARLFYFPLAAVLVLGYLVLGWWRKVRFSLSREGFLLLWMFLPTAIQIAYDLVSHNHTSVISRYLALTAPAMPLWAGLVMHRWHVRYPARMRLLERPLIAICLVYAVASVVHTSPVNANSFKEPVDRAAQYLSTHLRPDDLIFTNGPLGAPNMMVYYLAKTYPNQPFIYWMKQYGNRSTPLPDAESLQRYRRVWFFSNRSNRSRGLEEAGDYVRRFYPVYHPSIDPDHQLDLYTRE